MAITLEANYSKKLGLPQFSSHQFSVTIKTEIADMSQVKAESEHLYRELQESVDQSIKEVGWLPESTHANAGGNGNGNGHNGNGSNGTNGKSKDIWNCTPRQRDLILKIVDENKLNKNEVENMAKDFFNLGVKHLNSLQASQVIKELLEQYPGNGNGNQGRYARPANQNQRAS